MSVIKHKQFARKVMDEEHPDLAYELRFRQRNHWGADRYRGFHKILRGFKRAYPEPTFKPDTHVISVSYGVGIDEGMVRGLILHEISHIGTVVKPNKGNGKLPYWKQQRRIVHGAKFWKKADRLYKKYGVPQSFIDNEYKYRNNASNYVGGSNE